MNQHKRNALQWLAQSALALGAAGLLAACQQEKASFNAIDLSGADYAKGFSMPDQEGRLRTLADFQGKVVVVFFGYTQCPDVCPTTLLDLANVKQQLGAQGDRLQVVFVSVDPARDTPAVLKAYLANFDASFVGLSGSAEQLAAMAKDYKVYYKKVDGSTPGSYTMDHSAGDYLYDPQGRLRLYSRYGTPAEQLASDIRKLLDGA